MKTIKTYLPKTRPDFQRDIHDFLTDKDIQAQKKNANRTELYGAIISKYGSITDFANRVGNSPKSVCKVLIGGNSRLKTILTWSRALQLTPEQFDLFFF